MVCLIKPQFEAGREKVGKNGVVRDPETHREVISKIITFADMIGFDVKAIDFSPIKGPEGNIEYLTHIVKRDSIPEDIIELNEQDAEKKLSEMLLAGEGLAFETEYKSIIDGIVSQSHEL